MLEPVAEDQRAFVREIYRVCVVGKVRSLPRTTTHDHAHPRLATLTLVDLNVAVSGQRGSVRRILAGRAGPRRESLGVLRDYHDGLPLRQLKSSSRWERLVSVYFRMSMI